MGGRYGPFAQVNAALLDNNSTHAINPDMRLEDVPMFLVVFGAARHTFVTSEAFPVGQMGETLGESYALPHATNFSTLHPG